MIFRAPLACTERNPFPFFNRQPDVKLSVRRCRVTVHNRVNFATSMIDGRTVMETDEHCCSAEEIAGLWDYLEGRLEKCGSQWTSGFFNQVTRLISGTAA